MGVLVASMSVAAATAAIFPLKQFTPVLSLGVLYVPAVVVVSAFWGLGLGVGTSVLSAAAFNFFHLPPGGRFALADDRDWAALVVFVVVAVATGLVAELARSRGLEADRRRKEADLAAELAHLLLGAPEVRAALTPAGRCLANSLGVDAAAIRLAGDSAEEAGEEASARFELHAGGKHLATLLVWGLLSGDEDARVRDRVLPPLESILGAALTRAELEAEVVETSALRRSDELKTAVLRSVSHDLRTPLTAVLAAATALDAERPNAENVREVREQVLAAGTRLARLIEKLLDLSQLQSGRAEPRHVWYSIEEVLREAIEQVDAPEVDYRCSIEPELPLLCGDPAQLERAFANVLENAARYCAGQPVQVRAKVVHDRVRILIVDQGRGIPPGERDRIFLPFYRASDSPPHASGSGLGLAITRGFVELNGGRVHVESVPGQGTTFVVEFELAGEGADGLPEGAAVPTAV
jgi:two-component system, OmpR family, sensor histidine kinase KdpD